MKSTTRTFHRATFGDNPVLYIAFGAIALFTLWIGLRSHETGFAIFGLLTAAILVAIRVRFYVSCDGEHLEARGLFRTHRIALTEITVAHRAAETGYWASRFYGPSTYRFRTPSDHLTINFKLYSRACLREVMARLPTHVLIPLMSAS